MNHSIFSEDERDLLDAARLILSAGLSRLSDRTGLFPTARLRAVNEQCREARDTLAASLVAEYGGHRHEVAVAAFIDAQGRLIDIVQLSEGKATHCEVNYRKLAGLIASTGAVALLLAHNHPSGQCSPSREDIKLTDFLAEWLAPMDCALIDHLVLTVGDWASIKGEW